MAISGKKKTRKSSAVYTQSRPHQSHRIISQSFMQLHVTASKDLHGGKKKRPSKNGLIKVVPLPSLEAKKKSQKGQEPLPALKSLSRVMSPRTPQPLPKEGWPASPTMPQTPLVKGGHQSKFFS